MAKKSINRLLRQIHNWGAIIIALPIAVIIGTGVLLNLKKDVGWIQPPTQKGATLDLPAATLEQMFAAARSVPGAGIESWGDLVRVDFKPDKGVVKFVSNAAWEVQIDTTTAAILQVAYRRSDLIEQIHDGSFFAGWTKHYLFLPTAVVLFVLWGTGVYMFFLPRFKKAQKRRRARTGGETRP